MTRKIQVELFNRMLSKMLDYIVNQGLPVRMGELHRPKFVAEHYVKLKTGILNSLHRKSLAIDIWVSYKGYDVAWEDSGIYEKLAIFWESMGGKAGRFFYPNKPIEKNDIYHFEFNAKYFIDWLKAQRLAENELYDIK